MPVTNKHADALIASLLGDMHGMSYKVIIPSAREFQQAAQHILYVLEGAGPDAQEPGHFTSTLIQAMLYADEDNRRKLARVYPALAAHVHLYKTHDEGVRIMHVIANLLSD